MIFRVVGVLEVAESDEVVKLTAAKPRRMLTALLLRANHWVPDGELVEAIWPAEVPASAAGNMKTYVTQLRQLIGPRIHRRSGAYRLEVARHELDSMIFEDLVERGVEAEPAEAVALLTEALAHWRGTPYESFDVEAAVPERARLTELRWTARTALADALAAAGRHDEAIALLRAMTTEDPLRERVWLRLMEVLHRQGRRAEALITFQAARRAIVDDLGVEPGEALRELHLRLLGAEEPPGEQRPRSPRTGEASRELPPVDDDAPAPTTPAARVRRWRTPVLLAAALLVVVVVIASLLTRGNPPATTADPTTGPTTDPATTTAAERHGWGEPDNRAEFDAGLDGRWIADGPGPGRDNQGRRLPSQVGVSGGLATITGTPAGDTGFLRRRLGRSAGRIEARIRVPAGCACYRAVFTLWPDAAVGGLDLGEVVWLEVLDSGRQQAEFFLDVPDSTDRRPGRRDVDLTTWNNFAVEWTEDHVSGFVNGERWFHDDVRADLPTGALSPSIKLDYLPSAGESDAPSTLVIDWIREYPA